MATYDYRARQARASEAGVWRLVLARNQRLAVAWTTFIAGLICLMAALLVGPRVAEHEQKPLCVGNVHLAGPFGLSLNCDSPQFMALSREPSALLEPENVRQSRPGMIVAAALLQAPLSWLLPSNGLPARSIEAGIYNPEIIADSFRRELPAYTAYILLNVVLLLASFYVLCLIVRPGRGRDVALGLVLGASGIVLIANDVTKAFVWSPHTQMFNILVPLLALYMTLRAWQGAMNDRAFAVGAGLITGLGILTYPVFVVIPACVVPLAVYLLWRDRAPATPVLLNLLLLLLALSGVPFLIWYLFVIEVVGDFFQAEMAIGEVVWMAESWAKGVDVFIADWLEKAWKLIAFAAPQAIAVAVLAAWLAIWAFIDPRARAVVRAVAPVALAAAYVSVAVLGFYTCVGWTVDRLGYPIIPAFLGAVAVAATLMAQHLERRTVFAAGCVLIAVAQIIYVAAKEGPWS
jgi:hypothetical protein